MAEKDPTPDFDVVVRKLIVTPNPEFTLSLREPRPVNEKIANDFFKQGNIELLELKDLDQCVRWTGCQPRYKLM